MTSAAASSPDIVERVVRLGGDRALCAIVARPKEPTGLPAIVILNTGIIHRVGHHRLYTTLSRRLARRGFPVIRFDFAGIGDSPAQKDDLPPLEANCDSLALVIDWAEQNLSCASVILMGLCSGADHSLVYSGDDPRVSGVVLMDPSIPRTRRFHLIDGARRLKSHRMWTNLASGKGRTWAKLRNRFVDGDPPPQPVKDQFSRQDLESPETIAYLQDAYQKLVDNRVSILAVFTGGHSYQHNYRRQILDALPDVNFGDHLDLHYFAESDHTFTYEDQREELSALLDQWLERVTDK